MDAKTVKVKFTQDHVVQDGFEGTRDEAAFKAGKSYTMSAASARHFVIRGLADVLVKAPAAER